MPFTLDSNSTGLSFAAEVVGSPGTLPGSPQWYVLQPNNYKDFGAKVKTAPRTPITEGRQRLKGPLVDLDSMGGIEVDFTQNSLQQLMPGLFYAAWRYKWYAAVTSVAGATPAYTVGSTTTPGVGVVVNSLIFAQGFTNAANNGLKVVTAVTGTTVTAAGLVLETPPAGATITVVGYQAASADLAINGSNQMTSTTLDFTTLGFIPGEWIAIGGDAAASQFATAADNGFVRMSAIAAHLLTFDRYPSTLAADAGTGKTIQLFFGHVIRNEPTAALIVRQSYALERQIVSGSQYETLTGQYVSKADWKVEAGKKIVLDLDFAGKGWTTAASAAAGTRNALVVEAAFNATSNIARGRLVRNDTNLSLINYVTDFTISFNNNLSALKAVSVLGSLDQNPGFFEVSGQLTGYYVDTTPLTAIINNVDFSIDLAMTRSNAGWIMDLPTVVGSEGNIKIELNKPIMIPVKTDSAKHPTYGHSALMVNFVYLPTALAA